MIETKANTSSIKKKRIAKKSIPKSLIYEEMDGKPIYYKGYEQVIYNEKTEEEIMGTSGLQSLIIDCLVIFFHDNLERKKYKLMYNELGLHLEKKNNLAADIAIYEKSSLITENISNQYLTLAPKIILEVDTKADLNNFEQTMDYFDKKTKKLLAFGVEKIIWILTLNKKIMIAEPNKPWAVCEWSHEIEVFDNYKFVLNQLLLEDGIIKDV